MIVRQQPDSIKAIGQILCSMAMKFWIIIIFIKSRLSLILDRVATVSSSSQKLALFSAFTIQVRFLNSFQKCRNIVKSGTLFLYQATGILKKAFPLYWGKISNYFPDKVAVLTLSSNQSRVLLRRLEIKMLHTRQI